MEFQRTPTILHAKPNLPLKIHYVCNITCVYYIILANGMELNGVIKYLHFYFSGTTLISLHLFIY